MEQKKDELLAYICQHIKEYVPEKYQDCDLDARTVVRTNDRKLTGISLAVKKGDGSSIAPCVYLEDVLKAYMEAKGMQDMAVLGEKDYRKICFRMGEVFRMALKDTEQISMERFLDFSEMKPNIKVHVCDAEKNQKMLSGVIHERQGDFAQYYVVAEYPLKNSSVKITDRIMEQWGTTREEIHKAAKENAKRDMVFFSISEYLTIAAPGCGISPVPMYILTSVDNKFGAGGIMNPDIQDMIAKKLNGDYYVLPSSKHEVILLPEEDAMPLEEMTELVQSVNRSEVSEEDFLSDQVQHYSAYAHVLENAGQYVRNVEKNPEKYGKEITAHEKVVSMPAPAL